MSDIILCHLTKTDGDWIVRVDKPHGDQSYHQKHVHISRRKLKGEYSWNLDGSRHDKHRFPVSEQQLKRAKRLAADALGGHHGSLQLLSAIPGSSHVKLQGSETQERYRTLISSYLRIGEIMIIFGSEKGIVLIITD